MVPAECRDHAIDKVAVKLTGKTKVGKYNIAEKPGLELRFVIRNIPTSIIFHNGKEIDQLIELQPEHALIEKISALEV